MNKHVLILLLLVISPNIFAQEAVPFELREVVPGFVDFTMIGATMNAQENGGSTNCDNYNLPADPSATLNLNADQSIVKAFLYWSANTENEGQSDEQVTLNNTVVTADRTYNLHSNAGGGNGYDFYSCMADVTTIVQNTGNGDYTVTDLRLFRGDCTVSYGGWSIVIVYSDPAFNPNTVYIYDGFVGVSSSNTSVDIPITGIQVAQTLGSYIGVLGWEGDRNLNVGEGVQFNGNQLSNSLNQNTLFNGTNTFTNDSQFHNMDLDRFDISNYVNVGDESALFQIQSGMDLAIANTLVFTLYSELPDATTTINSAESSCVSDNITVNFNVNNFESFDVLPAGTSVKFYFDSPTGTPVHEVFTSADLGIGETENFVITLPQPSGDPTSIQLYAVTNTDENGEPIILELSYINNETIEEIQIPQPPEFEIPVQELCDDGTSFATFDLDQIIATFEGNHPNHTISIHSSQPLAESGDAPMTGNFTTTQNPQELWSRQTNTSTGCVGYVPFNLVVNPNPTANNAVLETCSNAAIGIFTLSNADADVVNEGGTIVQYFATYEQADDATATPLPNPYSTTDTTVFARVSYANTGCYAISEVELNVYLSPEENPVEDVSFCENDGDETVQFDLTSKIPEILGSQDANQFSVSFHTTATGAQNDEDEITNPDTFENTENPQTIFIRVENNDKTDCERFMQFQFTVNPDPTTANAQLQECSDNDTATFNLPDANGSISSDTGVNVLYFATAEEAQDLTATPLPNAYTTTNTTVYARAAFSTGCWATAELELQVNLSPQTFTLADEFLCEDDNNGSMAFDLTSKESEILGSQDPALFNYGFYLDAAATTPINNPQNFENTSNPQTIFVQVQNVDNASCSVIMQFDITVNPIPQANDVPISVPTCSSTPNAIFNLDAIALEVAANDASMTVEFFEDSQLTVQIANTSAYDSPTTTIYGKVTNPTTGCYGVGEVQLQVLGTPERRDQSRETCATNADNNAAVFDLTTMTDDIIGTAQNVTVTYHENFDDANSNVSGGLNAITDEANFSSITQVIYARSEATYGGNFCHEISEITLTVNPRPVANAVLFQICSNGSTQDFDLNSRISEITGGASGITVAFFEDAGLTTPVANPSAYNSADGQVFAQLVNDTTGCEDVATISLDVIENPDVTEAIERETCTRQGVATFDLAQLNTDLQANYPNYIFTFYEDQALTTPLSNTFETDQSVTVYVSYALNGTDCTNMDEVKLTVTPTPVQPFGEKIICLSQGYTLPDGQEVFEPGYYERFISDPNGCDILTTTTLIVGEVQFANAFAPNSNDKNEGFGGIPGAECVGEVTNYHLEVWNRWGEKVFETTDFIQQWDGRFNGELLEGTYLWRATYTFQEKDYERSGTVALIF